MDFKDFHVFFLPLLLLPRSNSQRGSFEWPLRRCSSFLKCPIASLDFGSVQTGGKRSQAEVFCELQARGQSTSSVQPLKGQFLQSFPDATCLDVVGLRSG